MPETSKKLNRKYLKAAEIQTVSVSDRSLTPHKVSSSVNSQKDEEQYRESPQ